MAFIVEPDGKLIASSHSANVQHGDEFVVLVDEVRGHVDAVPVRRHLEELRSEPPTRMVAGTPDGAACSGAAGLAPYPGDADTADDLIGRADRDMCRRKREGKPA